MKFVLRTKNGLHVNKELKPCSGGTNIKFFDTKAEAMFVKKELVDNVDSKFISSWTSDLFAKEVPDDYEY